MVFLAGRIVQWLPGGVWDMTPQAAEGLSPLDVPSDVEAATWAFASGYGWEWSCS